jgi:acetoin:2,6-dichlorophenolindophenol oxidoreductase subunit alpha
MTTTARLPEEVLPPPAERVERTAIADVGQALEMFRQMALIRRFEDEVQPLYNAGHVRGTTHLCSGQEAIGVGVASVLGPEDRVAATYRGHGHALALGSDPQALMDELLGRATGTCGGRAGSMNVVDLEHRLIGCFGIVGGSIAAATGAALALRGTGAIAVAFFGDGAVNQGYFHECLNFSQVHGLPVLLVCENNLYGEFTPWEQVTAGSILERPAAMGIPARRIDGNDVWVVRQEAGRAVEEVRAGSRPLFIEAITYRFGGHSRSDPGRYRPPGELDGWKGHDPLLVARRHLMRSYGIAPQEIDAILAETEARVQQIIAQGLAAPAPEFDAEATEFKP